MAAASKKVRTRAVCLLAALLAATTAAAGDQRGAQPQAPAAPAPQARVAMPGGEQIVILIRTTLIRLDDALATGNFTVLRDRAAPSFQSANSAARLSRIYRSLSQQGIDLGAAAMVAPELTATPRIDAAQRLHLQGRIPLRPTPITFALMFEVSGGQWRLFGISVNPAPVAPVAAVPLPAPKHK